MPLFEYRCGGCGFRFERFVSGQSRPRCPECESSSVRKLLSVFAVGSGSSRSVSTSDGPSACGSCGDPRGPGSCNLD